MKMWLHNSVATDLSLIRVKTRIFRQDLTWHLFVLPGGASPPAADLHCPACTATPSFIRWTGAYFTNSALPLARQCKCPRTGDFSPFSA